MSEKNRLMNTVTVTFNTTVRQMIEMSQRKKNRTKPLSCVSGNQSSQR